MAGAPGAVGDGRDRLRAIGVCGCGEAAGDDGRHGPTRERVARLGRAVTVDGAKQWDRSTVAQSAAEVAGDPPVLVVDAIPKPSTPQLPRGRKMRRAGWGESGIPAVAATEHPGTCPACALTRWQRIASTTASAGWRTVRNHLADLGETIAQDETSHDCFRPGGELTEVAGVTVSSVDGQKASPDRGGAGG